jgi:hypothetical protein
MQFNLDALNPGVRFYFDEEGVSPDPKQGWIELRQCSGDELTKITKQTRKKKETYRTVDHRPQRFEYEAIDNELENRLVWDYCITDWFLPEKSGRKIECNADNKVMMMTQSPTFMSLYAKFMGQLTKTEPETKDDEEKN